MKRCLTSLLLAGCVAGVIIVVCGCCVCGGRWGQEKYEKTESFSAAMAGVERISIDTSFGDIMLRGTDTTDCNVIAKITGRAPTADEAKQLAEQTQIKLETEGKTLVVRAEKPNVKHNRCIGIAYDIVVPKRLAVKCKSSYGAIRLGNIEGDVEADTSFGEIRAEKIAGRIQLNTSYGKVDCRRINSSDFRATSSFGEMNIGFSDACPADLKAKIETSFGEINVDIPQKFAGSVAVDTSFGNIKTDLPVLVKGDFGKDHLKGTIGQPKAEGSAGKLALKTSFGNVKIR